MNGGTGGDRAQRRRVAGRKSNERKQALAFNWRLQNKIVLTSPSSPCASATPREVPPRHGVWGRLPSPGGRSGEYWCPEGPGRGTGRLGWFPAGFTIRRSVDRPSTRPALAPGPGLSPLSASAAPFTPFAHFAVFLSEKGVKNPGDGWLVIFGFGGPGVVPLGKPDRLTGA